MADQISPIFNTPSQVLANYNFIDIANGLGFESYYAIRTKSRTVPTVAYVNSLSRTSDVWPTETRIQQTTVASTTFNFDTSSFALQRLVKGTAVFNACLTNEEADNQECKVTVQLLKVAVGGATTALSSAVVWDRTAGPPDSSLSPNEEENMLIYLPLTETIIKGGESIRLAVTLEMISGAGTDTMNVYCNPQDGAIGTTSTNPDVSSQMQVDIPFKIFT